MSLYQKQETRFHFSYGSWEVVYHRSLRKDIKGTVMETPEEMFRRVAYTVAAVEAPRIPNLRINCMKYLLPKKAKEIYCDIDLQRNLVREKRKRGHFVPQN